MPEATGRRSVMVNFINWYMAKLHKVAHHDPVPGSGISPAHKPAGSAAERHASAGGTARVAGQRRAECKTPDFSGVLQEFRETCFTKLSRASPKCPRSPYSDSLTVEQRSSPPGVWRHVCQLLRSTPAMESRSASLEARRIRSCHMDRAEFAEFALRKARPHLAVVKHWYANSPTGF